MNFRKLIISNWPIIVILIVTAILRFWRLDSLTTFGGDQGVDFENIRSILNGNLTLLGPRIGPYNDISSLYLGPLYYYLLAPFIWITKLDPIGASIAITLSRLIAGILIYFVTRKLFGRTAAILSLIISVLSPYWVNYLGPPSSPYFIIPTAALIIFLISSSKNKTPIFWMITGFLTGVTFHFHYLTLVILPAILFYLFSHQRAILKKSSLAFFLGFIISISPIILFELRHKFFLTNQLIKQLVSDASPIGTSYFVSNLKNALGYISEDAIGINSLYLLFFILFAFSIYLLFKKAIKEQKPTLLFLIYLIALNLIFASLYFGSLQPHYLAVAYVSIFIFAGAAIAWTKRINKYLPIVLIILVSIFLFPKNNFFSSSGYTMPEDLNLIEIRKIAKIITDDVGLETFNIAATLDGDSRAGPYRYLVKVYGKNPAGVENYDGVDNLYVITRDPARSIRVNNLFEIASFQPSNVTGDWSITGDIHLIKLSKKELPQESPQKFITIVNPVRSRKLWNDNSISHLEEQIEGIQKRGLKATWLLQYDNLFDEEIINIFNFLDGTQEVGAFLEVSEKWATDARVSYKVAVGDYYRPDKVFLSGYTPQDRQKLIKTYFNEFQSIFGRYPQSVGAWYIDANSQILVSKLGVKSALTVADQFDTDAASVWGKYFSMPYYPSKLNSLEPAINQSNRIPIVNIQWAQRDPVMGYGKEIKDSRQSFQANDYTSNGYDFSYFDNLLAEYFKNDKTDFVQLTIGLEAGQEAVRFKTEFEQQLDRIYQLKKQNAVEIATMEDFANWYTAKYPGISPPHFLKKGESFWYMSPKLRVAIFKEGQDFLLKDLRYYSNIPYQDYLYADENPYLDRKIPAVVDNLMFANQINLGSAKKLEIVEKFDRLILILDNREVGINTKGVKIDEKYLVEVPIKEKNLSKKRLNALVILNEVKHQIMRVLGVFRYSKIEGEKVFGIAISESKLVGLKGYSPGIFSFEFQSFSKFLSPSNFLAKWQPWIN